MMRLFIMCIFAIVLIGAEEKLWLSCDSSCKTGTIVKLLVPEHGLPIGQLTQIVEMSDGLLVRIEDPTPLERGDLWIALGALLGVVLAGAALVRGCGADRFHAPPD